MAQPLSEEAKNLAAGYVLGELDPDEERQFRALLKGNAELVHEVRALSAVFRLLPQELHKIDPPDTLQDRILAAHQAATLPEHVETRPSPAARQIQPQGFDAGRLWKALAAGAAVLVVLGLGMNNWTLRQQLASTPQSEDGAIASILQRPNTRLVALKNSTSTTAGTVLFTPGQWDEVVVSLADLPNLPDGQVYRMWLTLKDGDVIPCGEFAPNAEGVVFARLTPAQKPTPDNKAAQVFVTAEAVSSPLQPQGTPILSVSL